MPKGELSPSRKTERVSATPSPSASHEHFHEPPLEPLAVVRPRRPGGLGSQHIAIGKENAATAKPAAGMGLAPMGHPVAVATLIVGISVWLGCGSSLRLHAPGSGNPWWREGQWAPSRTIAR